MKTRITIQQPLLQVLIKLLTVQGHQHQRSTAGEEDREMLEVVHIMYVSVSSHPVRRPLQSMVKEPLVKGPAFHQMKPSQPTLPHENSFLQSRINWHKRWSNSLRRNDEQQAELVTRNVRQRLGTHSLHPTLGNDTCTSAESLSIFQPKGSTWPNLVINNAH